jgi:hypothetical protein
MSWSKERNPFETDVVIRVEHTDNDEKKRSTHKVRYCTTMLPDEYLAEEK